MAARRSSGRRAQKDPKWADWSDEDLLEMPFCDLGLRLEDTPLQQALEDIQDEFAQRELRMKPYAWLSTDWFTPDGMTGFAAPFYLAHPRLARLERSQMLELEGGTSEWCRRIMRHEAAHALDNAYGLHRRKDWAQTFGRFASPYNTSYTPDPSSREHVLHLYFWYSQSHPAEDYAETFAVWLPPGSHWRSRYEGWGALRKLEYIECLAEELAGKPPKLRTRRFEEPLESLKRTIGSYYADKRQLYADEGTPAFDGQLLRLFSDPEHARSGDPTAASFLSKHRRRLVRHVVRITGQHAYLVDHVVVELMRRSRSRRLRLTASADEALLDAAVLLTSLTMQFLHGAHPRYQR
ncbi:MAG: hypothetical protein ACI8QC_004142 [Planctomycetota bacterium]|jgi:hypothetical protein